MKKLALFLSLVLISSCEQNTIPSQPQLAKDQEIQTPIPSPTAFTFPKLTDEESRSLEESLPTKTRQILTNAQEIELFHVKHCPGIPLRLAPIEPDKFLGCGYKKKV